MTPLEAFELWMAKAPANRACDFTFHMGVTRFDDEAERNFREIVRRGISSFKIFLAYKGAFGIDDDGALPHASAGEGTRRHRHRALRERDARGRAAEETARAKARPGRSGITRAGRRSSKRRACIT